MALAACKEKMPKEWLEASKKRADGVCECAKTPDPVACRRKLDKETPAPRMPDGWAVKYDKADVDQVDAMTKLELECASLAR